MQSNIFSAETAIVCAVVAIVFAAIGYLVSTVLNARRNTLLTTQLEQAQQSLAAATSANAQQQELLKQAESKNHQHDIVLSTLNEKLQSANETQARLQNELLQAKSDLAPLNKQIEESRQQHHTAEKGLEAAQTQNGALAEQVGELRERLAKQEQVLEQERAQVSVMKDTLAQEGKRTNTFQTAEKEAREQLQDHKAQLQQLTEKHEALQGRFAQLQSTHAKLETEREERDASHARELANFQEQKNSLTEHFKSLSNEILDAKAKALQETSKLTLSAVMTPFQQSIDSFKKEVQDIHHRETTQQGELRKELESLKDLNQQMSTEAHELSTALRGQKKLQGNWGELVLENVLDRSGLQLGKDYAREVSFNTEEGRQRPDAIVYLPQAKHLVIDAKVSLNAYTRYVNATDDLERSLALKEHVHAVGSRIRELADRDYYKLPGLNSPEIVFMFIPIESAFVEALKADETLFQKAIESNVLVATPTTLLTSLNIVRQLWRYEDQNKHTAALANKAEAVFKKLNTFLGSFEKLKKGLEAANTAYTAAENQLISGKGNLVKQVGEFKNLAPAIKAELPDYFVDKAALEIDFIPADSADDKAPLENVMADLLPEILTETETETN